MSVVVNKWGNNLGVRIPKSVADKIGISVGSKVSIEVIDSKIVISPIKSKYNLNDLLIGVNPEVVGGEYDWGAPIGLEAW